MTNADDTLKSRDRAQSTDVRLERAESAGVRLNPLVGELDETAGHGTFIAGLIRQKCADATILAIRVIQGATAWWPRQTCSRR